MNLRRLSYFVAIAQAGSFRRASDILSVAQPALSVQMARLEEEMGVRLFQKRGRGIEVTIAGQTLLHGLLTAMPGIDAAIRDAVHAGHGKGGTLSVGFVGSVAYEILPRVVKNLQSALPNTKLSLSQMTSGAQIEALRSRRLDVAVTREHAAAPGLSQVRILTEPFVVALPARSRLAELREINLRDLNGEPLVTLPTSSGRLREDILGQIADSGADLTIVDEVVEMTAMLGLVSAGRGISIVPKSVTRLNFTGVIYRPLRRPTRRAELWAMRRSDDRRQNVSELMKLFVSAARRG